MGNENVSIYETEARAQKEWTNEIITIDMYIHVYLTFFMYSVNEMSMKWSDMQWNMNDDEM